MSASKKIISIFLAVQLCSAGVVTTVQGAVIGVQEILQAEGRNQAYDRVDGLLADEAVRQRLIALGVDVEHARQRVRAMTPEEVSELARNIEHLPAGAGALEVIGVVFLVLLLLELVGVIALISTLVAVAAAKRTIEALV